MYKIAFLRFLPSLRKKLCLNQGLVPSLLPISENSIIQYCQRFFKLKFWKEKKKENAAFHLMIPSAKLALKNSVS